MRRWRTLALRLPIGAAMALSLVGVTAGSQPSSALAATSATKAEHRAVAPPKGKPAFSATFPRGSKLNTKVWSTCYPGANPRVGCTNFGNQQEREWYLPGQVQIYGGTLHLVAKRETTDGITASGGKKVYYCRSGMITSYPSLKIKYGFLQVVAKIPHAAGLWPALWLAAANLKYPPEVDFLESWGVKTETAVFLHPAPSSAFVRSRDRALVPVGWTTGWQTYSIRWTSSRLTYYVGSDAVLTVTKNVPHQLMYFVANVAQNLPVTKGTCDGQMQIRSVKYWKQA
jgi:beta-glucanase (GH16 family)